ncbi:MAG: oligosaccharide flippase family protein [Bacteroidetes bacterium]|nr:oligosaccharide flippase family protein [Bacteroidota bacterium]MBS1741114.1 oligosaccharide flippase family protein [Bacteroidota bacterium]
MSLKKLAGQTMWYGVSNIAARLLTYLLTPYLTYTLVGARGQLEFGKYSFVYAVIPILNVLYTYGMETAYFRYSQTEDNKQLYGTQLTAMLISTGLFSLLLWVFSAPVSVFANIQDHPDYVGWCALIVGLDAISALPYARLRKENRPRKYAVTKVAGIVVYVVSVVALFSAGKSIVGETLYNRYWGLGFILFANVLQSVVTLLLLFKELKDYRPMINKVLLSRVLLYGFPILIAGFAGTINDTLNRVMFQKLYPVSEDESLRMVGIYTAAVRLSIMINLAIQAFRMAAEPFFFSMAKEKNAPETYARVMKWFVIALCVMFLSVMLYLDIWKYFVGRDYRNALNLVPVLLLSYVFLGIYYNLTVWYKLTDKTRYGAYIMLIGSVVTVAFNWILIPTWGYDACAWGTLACYGTMMVLSYAWGQKYYPIPYDLKKLLGYLSVMLILFFVQKSITGFTAMISLRIISGTLLFMAFFLFIFKREKAELKSFPLIKRLVK